MNDPNVALAQFLLSEKDTRPFNDTVRRTMLTPFAQSGYNNAPTYAAPSVLMDIYNAATLPKRVYDGKTAPNDMGENLNFTMSMMGGGSPARGSAATTQAAMQNKPVQQGLKAYHVSPHDFKKFDINKVGSGIGANTEGHGLYFTTSEKLINDYADILSEQGLRPHRYEVNLNINPEDMLSWDHIEKSLPSTAQFLRTPEGSRAALNAGKKAAVASNTGVGFEGTKNYTVFDDSLVEILRKYGLIGGAVGLGAASQQGDY